MLESNGMCYALNKQKFFSSYVHFLKDQVWFWQFLESQQYIFDILIDEENQPYLDSHGFLKIRTSVNEKNKKNSNNQTTTNNSSRPGQSKVVYWHVDDLVFDFRLVENRKIRL